MIGIVRRWDSLSPSTSAKSWAEMVVKITSALKRSALHAVWSRFWAGAIMLYESGSSMRYVRNECLPIDNVAPISNVKYPPTLQRFFKIGRPLRRKSSWSISTTVRAKLARAMLGPEMYERARQNAARTKRNVRACSTVTLPEGRGLQGLFILSSCPLKVWFDTLACSKWNHTHTTVRRSARVWKADDTATAKRV